MNELYHDWSRPSRYSKDNISNNGEKVNAKQRSEPIKFTPIFFKDIDIFYTVILLVNIFYFSSTICNSI